MNAFTILEAMDAIDDRTLEGAFSFAQKAVKPQKKRKAKWLPWVAAAACLCLIVAGAVGIIRKSLPAPSDFVIQEGVLIGISSGACLHAAIELAKKRENAGKTIVALMPDSGERYLSTDMYRD